VASFKAAVEKVRWYAQRWQIEVLHKVLKSGCAVEQRQLETAARLQRVVVVDLIVGWRVLTLCKAGREKPGQPRQPMVKRGRMARLNLLHGRTANAAAPRAHGATSGALDSTTGRLSWATGRRRAGSNRGLARVATITRHHCRLEEIRS